MDTFKNLGVKEIHVRATMPEPEVFFVVKDTDTIEHKCTTWDTEILHIKGCGGETSVGSEESFRFCGGERWGWLLFKKIS